MITVRLFDAAGQPLASGGDAVTITSSVGSLTPVTDHGDGRYTAALSSTEPGTALVSGTVNGSPIADTAEVVFVVV